MGWSCSMIGFLSMTSFTGRSCRCASVGSAASSIVTIAGSPGSPRLISAIHNKPRKFSEKMTWTPAAFDDLVLWLLSSDSSERRAVSISAALNEDWLVVVSVIASRGPTPASILRASARAASTREVDSCARTACR